MFRYAVIGSGSCGNSYIFETDSSCFVVDQGYSFSEFSRRARSMGFDVNKIKYVFVTHNHRDHTCGVEVMSNALRIPVFASREDDFSEVVKKGMFCRVDVNCGETYTLDDFSFTVFKTFHDDPASVGYSFRYGDLRFTIITDTGKTSPEMERLSSDSDIIFLESNYCPHMLMNGPYPYYLKKRIMSECGHLSNFDALEFLNKLDSGRRRAVYLCHISAKNNSPDRVREVFDGKIGPQFDCHICRRGIPVPGIEF